MFYILPNKALEFHDIYMNLTVHLVTRNNYQISAYPITQNQGALHLKSATHKPCSSAVVVHSLRFTNGWHGAIEVYSQNGGFLNSYEIDTNNPFSVELVGDSQLHCAYDSKL